MRSSWTDGVHREVLPNGLRLLVQRETSAPVAAVTTHVEAGFFDEPDHWVGISHVLEHMFFKGTSRRGVGDIAKETKAAGGYLNAGTGYDHTAYFVVLPADRLPQALDIQADALRNSVIDPEELDRELKVIIQEAQRKKDSAASFAWETLHEVMFDHHRIRRWRIGTEAQLERLTRDDLWQYYASRYVPERTIVSIVGDVDVEDTVQLARKAYGDWTGNAVEIEPSPAEPDRTGVRARTMRGDIVGAHLALGWRGVAPLHPDAPALDMAAAVLGLGRGSWLYQSLRTSGLVTSVAAHHYAPTELGVFSVTAETEPERIPAVVQGVAESVSRLALSGPDHHDMERARTLLLTRWARHLEGMDGRASALAAAEALEHVSYLDRAYAELSAVTADQVRYAAHRYLVPDDTSAVIYLPEGQGADFTADDLHRAFSVVELRTSPALEIPLPGVPAPRAATSGKSADVHHAALPAADLLVRRKAGVPTVTIGMYRSRRDIETVADAGLASLANRTAVRGAGDYGTAELAFAFEELGGSLSPSITSDWTGFSATVRNEKAGEAAVLLSTVMANPRFDRDDVARERALLIEEAKQVRDDMLYYPLLLGFRAAFGDRGYGLPVHGLPEALARLDVADLSRWHEQAGRSRPVVVAVGDAEPERLIEQLAGVAETMPAIQTGGGTLAQAMSLTGVVQEVENRAKAQTGMAMIFPGPGRGSPDRHAALVLSAVASGLGGRLFEALRDRRSLAYTVLASSWQRRDAGAFLTYIAMAPEREAEAREAMLAELEVFRQELVSEEELERAVNYLAGQAMVSRQNGSAVAGEIVEAWLIGTGLGELEDPAAGYRSVTREDVLRVAAGILEGGRRAEGVVRGVRC